MCFCVDYFFLHGAGFFYVMYSIYVHLSSDGSFLLFVDCTIWDVITNLLLERNDRGKYVQFEL
jgi:hypothetical protein